jgi:hypothetical protein
MSKTSIFFVLNNPFFTLQACEVMSSNLLSNYGTAVESGLLPGFAVKTDTKDPTTSFGTKFDDTPGFFFHFMK